jgi:hypothetical protein
VFRIGRRPAGRAEPVERYTDSVLPEVAPDVPALAQPHPAPDPSRPPRRRRRTIPPPRRSTITRPRPARLAVAATRRRVAAAARLAVPGRNSGQPITHRALFFKLRKLGFAVGEARVSALRQTRPPSTGTGHRRRPRRPPHRDHPPGRQRRHNLEPLRPGEHDPSP